MKNCSHLWNYNADFDVYAEWTGKRERISIERICSRCGLREEKCLFEFSNFSNSILREMFLLAENI